MLIPLFLVPIPVFPSTKSGFLCAFGLRDPHFQASRAQNRGFCALLPSETPVYGVFEHKIGVFVRFWLSRPSFSGFSSTKLRFLCFFGLRNPCFRAFRAQNRGFCAFLPFETLIFGLFEHKIDIFVLGQTGKLLRSATWWRCGGALLALLDEGTVA